MEAGRTSEMSVYFIVTTRRYIPEGCNLYTHIVGVKVFCHVPVWLHQLERVNNGMCIFIVKKDVV
jgi:hypothetical protein